MNRQRGRWILFGLAGLTVFAAIWIVLTGLLARHELNAARNDLGALRSAVSAGDQNTATTDAATMARHARRAHELTSGPAWWVGSQIPWLGDPLRTSRGLAQAVNSLITTTVPDVIDVSTAIDPSQVVAADHHVDISALTKATPRLDAAVADANRQQQLLAGLPRHTWLAPVNNGANAVVAQLGELIETLDTADQVARAAPTLLGFTAPQRYFVAFQNDAETRGTGGLPGAFGIVVANHGTLTFTHFGSDSELDGVDSGLTFDSAYEQTWHDFEPTTRYLNSNVDPDFRYAAQIWAAMWQRKSGEHVDGAFSIDPTALSYLLRVTGPAAMPDGSLISASNIVTLTQSTVYSMFTAEAPRRQYLLNIARVVEQKIFNGAPDAKGLYQASSRAIQERRLLFWDADNSIEEWVSAHAVGGTIPDTAAPYIAPTIINYGADKLDYYLKASYAWSSTGCGAIRDVTVTITLTNLAPTGLPSYVTQRLDEPPFPVAAGDNRILLYYVGSQGGGITSITIGGAAATVSSGRQGDHPTYSALVELPRATTQTVVLQLREPVGSGSPIVLRQPMVIPATYSITTARCG
jgi:Protein of unknown function (DUF4012)